MHQRSVGPADPLRGPLLRLLGAGVPCRSPLDPKRFAAALPDLLTLARPTAALAAHMKEGISPRAVLRRLAAEFTSDQAHAANFIHAGVQAEAHAVPGLDLEVCTAVFGRWALAALDRRTLSRMIDRLTSSAAPISHTG